MRETETRTVDLSGAEAARVRAALESHEPAAPDADAAEIAELEAQFDADLDGDETAAFDLTRADSRLVVAALEERELRATGADAERLLSLRERFAERFDFETRDVADGPSTEPHPSPVSEN